MPESSGLSAALVEDSLLLVKQTQPVAASWDDVSVPAGRAGTEETQGGMGMGKGFHQSAPMNMLAWANWRSGRKVEAVEEGEDGGELEEEEEEEEKMVLHRGEVARDDILGVRGHRADPQRERSPAGTNFLLYMETIQDLLVPGNDSIAIVEDPKTGDVSVPGVAIVEIRDQRSFVELLRQGEAHRFVANTRLNTESSRSHAILMVHVKRSIKGRHDAEPG